MLKLREIKNLLSQDTSTAQYQPMIPEDDEEIWDDLYLSPDEEDEDEKEETKEENDTSVLQIPAIDRENLLNFVRLYTEVTESELNLQPTKLENHDSRQQGCLESGVPPYDLGDFQIKVNRGFSVLEFLGLLQSFPLEEWTLPKTSQIPYYMLAHHLQVESQMALRLMVLGDSVGFWIFNNPHKQMDKTSPELRQILAEHGGFSIILLPNYLDNCRDMVQELSSRGFLEDEK